MIKRAFILLSGFIFFLFSGCSPLSNVGGVYYLDNIDITFSAQGNTMILNETEELSCAIKTDLKKLSSYIMIVDVYDYYAVSSEPVRNSIVISDCENSNTDIIGTIIRFDINDYQQSTIINKRFNIMAKVTGKYILFISVYGCNGGDEYRFTKRFVVEVSE